MPPLAQIRNKRQRIHHHHHLLLHAIVMEDHSSSSSSQEEEEILLLEEELDILRSDSFSKNSKPIIPSNANKWSFRHYATRLCQTGLAHLQSQWKIVLAGQVLSFLTAATGAAQATLSFDCHLSAPTLTLGICYAVLTLTVLPYLAYQELQRQQALLSNKTRRKTSLPPNKTASALVDTAALAGAKSLTTTTTTTSAAPYYFLGGLIPLQAHPLTYLPMAVLDVYANYFTVLAFKYTTITSVTLFDALAIPSAMILSYTFLCRQYSPVHLVCTHADSMQRRQFFIMTTQKKALDICMYVSQANLFFLFPATQVAVFCCIIGILLNVWEDYNDDQNATTMTTKSGLSLEQVYPHRTWGDVLAVVGGLLFGATNTMGEYAVRKLGGPYEYIGMMSFYAAIICLVQTLVLERDDIAAFTTRATDVPGETTCSVATAQWLLVAFTVATVATYLGAARFLQVSDAAFFNLSLLTGDLWSVIFSIFEEGIVPGRLFFVALVFIVAGVVVYEMTDAPSDHYNGGGGARPKSRPTTKWHHEMADDNDDGNVEMPSNNNKQSSPMAFCTSMQLSLEERAGLLLAEA